jgi:hypothetical protein
MERALHDAREHRGRYAVARHIGYEQRRSPRARGGVIVKISAERRTRRVAAADRNAIHRRARFRQQALLKCARFGHLSLEAVQVLTMFLAAPPQLDAALDERLQHFAIERLLDEIKRRAADGSHQLLVEIFDAAGHQNDIDRRKAGLQLRHQFEAVEIRHPDVDDRELRVKLVRNSERFARQARSDDAMLFAQHALDGAQHARLVVDDEDACRSHDH